MNAPDEKAPAHPPGIGAPGRSLTSPGIELEEWPPRLRRWIVLGILLVSLVVRIFYFHQLNGSACIWQHLWPQSDMHFFDRWGKAIAQGDWLSQRLVYPYLGWHKEFAETYFRLYPTEKAVYAVEGQDPGRAIWNHWFGGKRFYQEPLYAYLVGLTYRLGGLDPRWVFAWQMLLGMASNLLVYLVTRRCFGDLAATLAGFMAALCGVTLYFEAVLVRESLLVFLGWALVATVFWALPRKALGAWFLTGLVGGLAFLAKSTFLPLLVVLAAALGFVYRPHGRLWLRSLAGLAAGAAVFLGLQAARDIAVGVPPLSPPFTGVLSFIADNSAWILPYVNAMDFETTARVVGQSQGHVWTAIRATLATHHSVWHYLGLLWGKFTAAWHWYESPDNSSFYFYRIYAPVLEQTFLTFYQLAPLSVVGLALGLCHFRRCWLLYLVALMHLLVLLAFLPLSRYRLLFLSACLPFAGYTLAVIIRQVLRGQRIRAGLVMVAVLAVMTWTSRPLRSDLTLIRISDLAAPYYYYRPLIVDARAANDWPGAAQLMDQLLKCELQALDGWQPGNPWPNATVRFLAPFFGTWHREMADFLGHVKDFQNAAIHLARAEALESGVQRANANRPGR